ncbi:hypothetical protein P7C70_g2183, partial [Phenoliferia sp. Uapishka_3]
MGWKDGKFSWFGPPPTYALRSLYVFSVIDSASLFNSLTASSHRSLEKVDLNVYATSKHQMDFSVFSSLSSLSWGGKATEEGIKFSLSTLKFLPMRLIELTWVNCWDDVKDSTTPFSHMFGSLPDTIAKASLPEQPITAFEAFMNSGACPGLEKISVASTSGCYEGEGFEKDVRRLSAACKNRELEYRVAVGFEDLLYLPSPRKLIGLRKVDGFEEDREVGELWESTGLVQLTLGRL